MKLLRTLIALVIILMMASYAFAFAYHNTTLVRVDSLLGPIIELPFAVWLGIALLFGLFIGFLASLFRRTGQSLEVRRLQRELKNAKERLSKLAP